VRCGKPGDNSMHTRNRQHTQLAPVKTLALSNVRIVALATPIITIRITAEFWLPGLSAIRTFRGNFPTRHYRLEIKQIVVRIELQYLRVRIDLDGQGRIEVND
jgi:hypothetical protein